MPTERAVHCKNTHAQVAILRQELRKRNPKLDKPRLTVEQQHSGTEAAMLSETIRSTFLGLMQAGEITKRTQLSS